MRIGVDIDGVLYPWDIAAREALGEQYGLHLGPSTSWNAIRDAVPRHVWRWLWSPEGQDAAYGSDRVYEDAALAVRELLRRGHEVHFVTHRDPARAGTRTAEFLAREFGTTGRGWALHMVPGTPKRRLGPWDVFIDDKPETVLDLVAAETTMVLAPLRPWNMAELEGRDGPHLHVYTDALDIVRLVNARGARGGITISRRGPEPEVRLVPVPVERA